MNLLRITIKIFILLQCYWHPQVSASYCKCQTNRRHKELIERSMDFKALPCNDFYNYACGNWNEVYAEAGIKFLEPLTMLDYKVNIEMFGVLEDLSIKNIPVFLQSVHKYYISCKRVSNYESSRYFQFLKFKDEFKESQFDWVKTLALLRTYGLNDVFIQLNFVNKINDVNRFVIEFDKPVLDGGFKPLEIVNLILIMKSLPSAINTKDLINTWQDIEDFELQLKALDEIEDVSVETEEDYKKLRVIKYKDLPLDWLKSYLKYILNIGSINPEMELYIKNKPYMMVLDQLLRQYDQRVLEEYLRIRFLWHLHLYGPDNFMEYGCISNTRSLIPIAMNWLYERQHPNLLDEYFTIYKMFNKLREHFRETIQKNTHGFNSPIVQHLLSKLDNMKLILNNIPRSDTVTTLEMFYHDLNLNENNFYENHLKVLRFNFEARRALLWHKSTILMVNSLENFKGGTSISPYFADNVNAIVVPLALLQKPIYHHHLNEIFKYSSLGFILAHEMFHGFDDGGLFTGADGTLKFIQFEDNPLFNASLNCLMDINPFVINEKIADISGLRYAYQAYFDAHPEDLYRMLRLYQKDVSMPQLFFLNFAQFFCGDITPEQVVSAAYHGSDRERVMDALKNVPEFAKAYQCSRKDSLYPHDVCHLWRR